MSKCSPAVNTLLSAYGFASTPFLYEISYTIARRWLQSRIIHRVAEKGNRVPRVLVCFPFYAIRSFMIISWKHDSVDSALEQAVGPI